MGKYLNASFPFGLTGGAFCIIAFWLMHWMGQEPVNITLTFGYLIIPIFVFLGIKNYRDKLNGGELFFGPGMTVGFCIYMLIAMMSAINVWVALSILPEILETYRDLKYNMVLTNKTRLIEQLDADAVEKTLQSIQSMSAYNAAIDDFLRKIFPGLFFTIIISIILKRTKT
ncbi:DUF4199 domain-containing protein [Pararhodonellum marinum]|uniref:DUF4199 domain-containing protein n=1 Tax=Pararhodonellum marinum TaxID=2755358 RepID=UPI00188EB7E9|nr:DUF4199 domain-containing protein [Pararhodonellum marinum]